MSDDVTGSRTTAGHFISRRALWTGSPGRGKVWPAQDACPVPSVDVPSAQTKGWIPESGMRKLAVCIPGGFASISCAVHSHPVRRVIFTVMSLRPELAYRFFILLLFPSHSNCLSNSVPFSPPLSKRKEHREKRAVLGEGFRWWARGHGQLRTGPWRTRCWTKESCWNLKESFWNKWILSKFYFCPGDCIFRLVASWQIP